MLNWLKEIFSQSKAKRGILDYGVVNTQALIQQAFATYESGKLLEARTLFKSLLEIEPNNYDAIFFLGLIAQKKDEFNDAISLLKRAISLKSDEPEFYKSLGHNLLSIRRKQEAISAFEAAINLDTQCITTLSALFSTYRELGDFKNAMHYVNIALELAPDCWPALNARSDILLNCGKVELAIADLNRSILLNPELAVSYSSYLFALNYSTQLTAQEIFESHKTYDKKYGDGKFGQSRPSIKDPNPSRRLRIGYVSPDFFDHAVSIFMIPILEHQNNNDFESFCYHIDKIQDYVTDELKTKSMHWRHCFDWKTASIVEKIQEDQIDILVDLAGHTSNNRLEIFAAGAAPVQITWLGYINTTGLGAMDYRIVDGYSDPVGVSEKYHTEKLLRLPNSQWCFNKPKQQISVNTLPAVSNEYITFGSFNRFSKLSQKILKVWAELLISTRNSKLLIADIPQIEVENFYTFMASHGVEENRLLLHSRTSIEKFRALHHLVDIALDSYPYSGATTTCESLWMGVPTLTLVGETSVSRSTSSIMHTLNLEEWVTYSSNEFITAAINQANDLEKLAELRSNLREKLESSPIMDAPQFTKDIENQFRAAWEEKCLIG